MKEVTSKAIRVPKHTGEQVRRLLIEHNMLRTNLKIKETERELIFPITKIVPSKISFPVVTDTFVHQTAIIQSYKEIVQIPTQLKIFLPTSFDIIGDILLIKIPKELTYYKKNIGEALLRTHKTVVTVCSINAISGEFRRHPTEVIAGRLKTNTIHTEYGIQLYVDVAETYFSPRLAGERHRIASLVNDNEVIVDLFTGVAPFPLMITRYAHPNNIIAIDKNPIAVSLAKKNVMSNKALDVIDVFEMDATDSVSLLQSLGKTADRIIMNLPFDSFQFLPIAFSIMSKRGVIHLYEIIHEKTIQSRLESIKQRADELKITIKNMTVHRIKSYAPHEIYIGIDITAQKCVKEDADVA